MQELFKTDNITTFTKKYVNVFDPKPETLCIEDIAHALSKEQRFGNHLPINYSVAQHSIICAELSSPRNKLTALLHDASEAYIRDLPKPIKIRMPEYEAVEHTLMKCLSQKFGFIYPLPEEVKQIDKLMLIKEWDALMVRNQDFEYGILNQEEAEAKYLSLFYEIHK